MSIQHKLPIPEPSVRGTDRRYARLAATLTLAGPAISRWCGSRVAVCGAGLVGGRLAIEIVRSGAGVTIIDFDVAAAENLGAQHLTASGVAKAEDIRRACERIRPGSAVARVADVRHVGIADWMAVDAIVDATDDPKLEWLLVSISNGLAIPLLRVAVDGSGDREFGRVLTSHGGAGRACAICPKSAQQLMRQLPRVPCLAGDAASRRESLSEKGSDPLDTAHTFENWGAAGEGQTPFRTGSETVAGNAIAMTIAGVGLLQLQRLLGGSAIDQVLDTQTIVDLDHGQMFVAKELRHDACLSGHVRWDPVQTSLSAHNATLADLFREAARCAGEPAGVLEPFGHALCTRALCECGSVFAAVGARFAPTPTCPQCGGDAEWQWHTAKPAWSYGEAERAGILGATLAALGLPAAAMITAQRRNAPPLRLLLAPTREG